MNYCLIKRFENRLSFRFSDLQTVLQVCACHSAGTKKLSKAVSGLRSAFRSISSTVNCGNLLLVAGRIASVPWMALK